MAQSLAKRLEEQGATMFGAYWCSHCYAQKQLFGADAFARIRYVECARDGVASQAALCREKKLPVRPGRAALAVGCRTLFLGGGGGWGGGRGGPRGGWRCLYMVCAVTAARSSRAGVGNGSGGWVVARRGARLVGVTPLWWGAGG